MCGICGIIDWADQPMESARVARMRDALSHRGPDDRGVALLPHAGLGHTRLSVIDLSLAGRQPMRSADGRFTIVYNGEVYNFRELRTRLEGLGATFRSQCDTEVVLQAFVYWGTNAFAEFNGMFALAVWDAQERRLHLVRDRFGIKPLYYFRTPAGLVFGSEIKAILASGCIDPCVSGAGLHEYLHYGHALGENTLFEGVRRLQPGHWLQFDSSGVRIDEYWSVFAVEQKPPQGEQAAGQVLEHLKSAVRSHLVSDVPVGVFLSGGIDSSAITALGSQVYPGRLKTYSVGFDFDEGVHELPQARAIAGRFGTEHHELRIEGKNIADVIEALVRCHDEPFADAANIPLYLLCQQLGGTVKVILQGDGGDETFAGYRRHAVMSLAPWLRVAARIMLPLDFLRPRTPNAKLARRAMLALKQPDAELRIASLLALDTLDTPPTAALSPDARAMVQPHDPFARFREVHRRVRHLDPLQQLLYTDCAVTLPDRFLEKVDKATMAHGIEVRVPFLDRSLSALALGLPSRDKLRHGRTKWLLRRSLRGILPESTLAARKSGFGVPYEQWLRGPLAGFVRSVLGDKSAADSGLFDSGAIQRLTHEHTTGRSDHGALLYRLLNLALWHRYYLADRRRCGGTTAAHTRA